MKKVYSKYMFYQNKEFISRLVDIDHKQFKAVENDWQNEAETIPTLKNYLDILPKNPGIFPTESISQFDKKKLHPFFTRLPQYSQINEQCIGAYYPPGSDTNLTRIAMKHNSKYMMSTSTVTSLMIHIYYAISNYKSPHFNGLTQSYDSEPMKYMVSQRKPNTIFLRQIKQGDKSVYAVDGDSGFSEQNNLVLLKMGKYMEKMFTTDADFFNDHFVLDLETNKPKKVLTKQMLKQLNQEDYFRYMKAGNMLLRSQIDCRGEDADGKPLVFELKTRATAPLRYDIGNYIDYLDYSIVKFKGQHSSFEREFYDLIRGGFLKYIMQMKIGRMQGAAIAYHNTQKIYGFEYIPIE
jgi:hypothetical protein